MIVAGGKPLHFRSTVRACQTCSDKNLQTLPQFGGDMFALCNLDHVCLLSPQFSKLVPNSPPHGFQSLLTCRMKLGKSKQLCQHFLLGDSQPWVSLKVTRIFGLEIFRTTTLAALEFYCSKMFLVTKIKGDSADLEIFRMES